MSTYHASVPCTEPDASEELYAAILKLLGYRIIVKTGEEIFFEYTGSFFRNHPDLSLRYDTFGKLIGGVRICINASLIE